jgi:hypothetical protein
MSLFIEIHNVPVPNQVSERSCICELEVSIFNSFHDLSIVFLELSCILFFIWCLLGSIRGNVVSFKNLQNDKLLKQ